MRNGIRYGLQKQRYLGNIKNAAWILAGLAVFLTVGEVWTVLAYVRELSHAGMEFAPKSAWFLWVGSMPFSAAAGTNIPTVILGVMWELTPLLVLPVVFGACCTGLYGRDKQAGVWALLYTRGKRSHFYYGQAFVCFITAFFLMTGYLMGQLLLSIPITLHLRATGMEFPPFPGGASEIMAILTAAFRQCLLQASLAFCGYGVSLHLGRLQRAAVFLPMCLSCFLSVLTLHSFSASPQLMAYMDSCLKSPNVAVYIWSIAAMLSFGAGLVGLKAWLTVHADNGLTNEVLQ